MSAKEVNAKYGFEDPHCAEPYGVEIQSMMKSVLADSDSDTTVLCFLRQGRQGTLAHG